MPDINVQAGIILSEEANLAIAERFFERALNIYETEFGRDNLYTALVNFHLGKYHFMNANVSKSDTFLSEAIVGLEALESEDDVDQALLTATRDLFDQLDEIEILRRENRNYFFPFDDYVSRNSPSYSSHSSWPGPPPQ